MQFQNPDADRLDLRDELRDAAPSWLRIRVPETLPSMWRGLIFALSSLVSMMMANRPPAGLIMRIREGKGRLIIDIVVSSSHSMSDEIRALRQVAKQYVQLSRLLWKQFLLLPKSRELPFLSAEGTHDADLDLRAKQLFSHLEPRPETREIRVFTWSSSQRNDGGDDKGRNDETAIRIQKTMKKLVTTGPMRPLALPPPGWKKMVDELAVNFGNFASFTNTIVRPHATLLMKGIDHRMPPVLLVGPPGIGKTCYVQALVKALGASNPLFISMAAETNSSSLAGSSTFWSNSSPGLLFERLAWHDLQDMFSAIANPIVILDEIDKVVGGQRYDPLSSLYSLLEVESAKNFCDQSLPDIGIDASRVRFIATANDLTSIPEPLLSRMLVFNIKAPDRHQLQRIIVGIYRGLVDRLGVNLSGDLQPLIVDSALMLSPREAKIRLECAIASAISRDRDHLDETDWPVLPEAAQGRTRQRIGFVP